MQGPGNPDLSPHTTAEVDASRRTYLASERTQLAWWRTGLTALAVALGVGRVVPELSDSTTKWPYIAVGVCFALYGVAMFAYGSWRARIVDTALREGRFEIASDRLLLLMTVTGAILGLLTAALVIAD